MKQQSFTFEYDFSKIVAQEFTFERFYSYYKKTSSASKEKKTRRAFIVTFYDSLYERLANGTYIPSAYSCFFIKTPKPREVFAPYYDDRIIHHFLVDLLSPIRSSFIHDNYANQEGKGTHKAISKAQEYMRKYPDGGMCLKCDVKSFFSSINKDILFLLITKHLNKRGIYGEKRDLIDYLLKIIIFDNVTESPLFTNGFKNRNLVPKEKSLFYQKKNVGIPIGSHTSQFFALIYLNELDHFIKRELKVKHYVRYVDDFIIIEKDATNFKEYQIQINQFLKSKLAIELHPNKTSIQPSKNGIDLLGYITRPHRLLIRRRTVLVFKEKLAFFNFLLNPEKTTSGRINTDFEFMKLSKMYLENGKPLIRNMPYVLSMMLATVNSYYGIIGVANTYALRVSLYEKYFGVLKEFFTPKNSFRAFSIVKMTRTSGGHKFVL